MANIPLVKRVGSTKRAGQSSVVQFRAEAIAQSLRRIREIVRKGFEL